MAKSHTFSKRVKELLGMLLIGDAFLTAFGFKRHIRLWMNGPKFWRKSMVFFYRRPLMTRFLAVLEGVFGSMLAARQKPAS